MYLMKVVDTTQIYSFAPIAAQTDFPVSPSEEAVFILNSSQLQDIITQAIEKAIQPLQDRVKDLEKIVAAQGEQIAALASTQEQDVNRICLDIAYDRQRLARLEKVEPQPLQKDRGEILRALLAANGGKMLAKDTRQKMRLDKATFSRLLDTLKDDIAIKSLHTDKRKLVLMLKIS
jgi:uncharacterized membrane protein